MLKLQDGQKQNIILLVFTFLLYEILTKVTMGFVLVGVLLVFFKVKTNKLVRNILAILVFASYWITYGKIIDPEIGLNFLTSIIVLKILEKETVRDRYMIFFGLLLLISSGSLFERNIAYVFFFGISFYVLIQDFYASIGQRWRLKDLGLALIWVLPLTFLLFFFIPRVMSPIPLNNNQSAPGELGYSPDVNVSQIESLSGNNSPVFQVVVNKRLNMNDLYWRGNTLSYTDGWNWREMVQDRSEASILLGAKPEANEVKQTVRLFTKPEYFFTLDAPRIISYGRDFYGVGKNRTMIQHRWQTAQRYEAISLTNKEIPDDEVSAHYLQVPFSKKQKERIDLQFKGTTLNEVTTSIRRHFLDAQFSYSLAPGRSANFNEFMERKIGFCSHYSSAVAIILRIKGIPSRLVSGLMGGTYNHFANFYVITQNDSHVWVEAYENNKWVRIEPTEWIAPDRVQLGGEAFTQNVETAGFIKKSGLKLPKIFQDIRLWFGQWDFLFYQWLEEMDYYAQESWLNRLHFKRSWLFSLIPFLMVSFMLFYFWFLLSQKAPTYSEYQELWSLFYKKMKKRGLNLSLTSVTLSEDEILKSNIKNKDEVLSVWKELLRVSFKEDSSPIKDLKRRIQRF